MRPIYLIKDQGSFQRKVMLDMAWLSSHKQIRLPKIYFEEGLYLPFKSSKKNEIEKYVLTKDKILKEDNDHYFFKFLFKPEEVENALEP
jgi:hypothetical protein